MSVRSSMGLWGSQGHMVVDHPRCAERVRCRVAQNHRALAALSAARKPESYHDSIGTATTRTWCWLDWTGRAVRGGDASGLSQPVSRQAGPSACAWSPAAVESVASSSPQFRPSRKELAPKPPVIPRLERTGEGLLCRQANRGIVSILTTARREPSSSGM